MKKKGVKTRAVRAAFPHTIPIMAGFLFLGIAYGILMSASGFSPVFSIIISILVFAGSMQFVAVPMLLAPFAPVEAFTMTLMINARHLFYGVSMLERYKIPGAKKLYLIFGMCDETFSVNCTTDPPEDVDSGWFYFFVTLLDHAYWVVGTTIGAIFGSIVSFNTTGLDFVMTALFIVIFTEQCLKEKEHFSSILGLALPFVCLVIFGGSSFIIPSMIAILAVLTLARPRLEKKEARV